MAQTTVEVEYSELEKLIENLASEVSLKVGVLAGATNIETGENIAEYAVKHEYGIGVPPRPFLRNTISKRRDQWTQELSQALRAQDFDVKKAFEMIQGAVVGDVMTTITEGRFIKNSPKTIEEKKLKKRPKPNAPLIDSGSLLTSIGAEVITK